jgi:hypothetical protein
VRLCLARKPIGHTLPGFSRAINRDLPRANYLMTLKKANGIGQGRVSRRRWRAQWDDDPTCKQGAVFEDVFARMIADTIPRWCAAPIASTDTVPSCAPEIRDALQCGPVASPGAGNRPDRRGLFDGRHGPGV